MLNRNGSLRASGLEEKIYSNTRVSYLIFNTLLMWQAVNRRKYVLL